MKEGETWMTGSIMHQVATASMIQHFLFIGLALLAEENGLRFLMAFLKFSLSYRLESDLTKGIVQAFERQHTNSISLTFVLKPSAF